MAGDPGTAKHVRTAQEIMFIADGHSSNGMITGNEIRTFLSNDPKYKPFCEWLFRERRFQQPRPDAERLILRIRILKCDYGLENRLGSRDVFRLTAFQ